MENRFRKLIPTWFGVPYATLFIALGLLHQQTETIQYQRVIKDPAALDAGERASNHASPKNLDPGA